VRGGVRRWWSCGGRGAATKGQPWWSCHGDPRGREDEGERERGMSEIGAEWDRGSSGGGEGERPTAAMEGGCRGAGEREVRERRRSQVLFCQPKKRKKEIEKKRKEKEKEKEKGKRKESGCVCCVFFFFFNIFLHKKPHIYLIFF